jgi:hypothetical protein
MEAKDLRIGNLVMYSNNSTIFTVSGLHEFGMDCFDDIEETYIEYDQFEGISLTEEWLLKFGFEFKPTGDEVYEQIWKMENFEIWEHSEGFCHDFHNGGDLKYVHQFQNLYFALTGEELTIKE